MNICTICDKTFSTKGNMVRHVNQLHRSSVHYSGSGHTEMPRESNTPVSNVYSVGVEKHTPPKYFCGSCPMTFCRPDALKIHTLAGNCMPLSQDQPEPQPGGGRKQSGDSNLVDNISGFSRPYEHRELKTQVDNIYSKCGQCGYGPPSPGAETDEESVEAEPLTPAKSWTTGVEDCDEDENWYHTKRRKVDDLDRDEEETDDDDSLVNSSSDDEDECESSGDYSVGAEISEDCTGETQDCGVPDGNEESGDRDDEVQSGVDETQKHKLFSSWARWRAPENGLYVPWRTLRRKPFVVQHRAWLEKFLTPPYGWKQQILEASESQMSALREMAYNVTNGRVPIHIRGLKAMFKNKALIRAIADDDLSYRDLRRILVTYRDTAIPLLLLSVLPACIKSNEVVHRVDECE